MRGLWSEPRTMDGQVEKKARSFVATSQSSIRGIVVIFLALLVVVFFVSLGFNGGGETDAARTSWSKTPEQSSGDPQTSRLQLEPTDQASKKPQSTKPFSSEESSYDKELTRLKSDSNVETSHNPQLLRPQSESIDDASHLAQPSRPQSAPITLNCQEYTTARTCRRSVSSPSFHLTTPESSPSCPEYFRWIHQDLQPWSHTGITKEMVESAQKFATFRLVVLDGHVYVDEYFGKFMTRNVFTLWGILQLVNRYPGRIPDLDLMFNCMDQPAIKIADYTASTPPPLFHYCKDEKTMDILFPDWSFWGWPETNIKPWDLLVKDMKEENAKLKWNEREPYAYWKGNPFMGPNRNDLMKCNASNGREWNTRLYTQDWDRETKEGYKTSNLASQCHHRYKIYVEGFAWSVSQKYILACDSPTLLINPHFEEFFTRGLIPGKHYWPIPENDKCRSIKSAVDWGNQHPEDAQAMGKAGSSFVHEAVNMDNVYDYMLHTLNEYAKLLKYKPTKPKDATELCLESMSCSAFPNTKKLLLDSMVKQTHDREPCSIPRPFTQAELQELNEKKMNSIKQVEKLKTQSS